MANLVLIHVYLGLVLFFLLVACVLIVGYYAEHSTFPRLTYFTCITGYFCAFGILLTVPIDIASVVIDRRTDAEYQASAGLDSYASSLVELSLIYKVFFTMILILGSVVLVLEEYFNTDGKKNNNYICLLLAI